MIYNSKGQIANTGRVSLYWFCNCCAALWYSRKPKNITVKGITIVLGKRSPIDESTINTNIVETKNGTLTIYTCNQKSTPYHPIILSDKNG
jgi:hypothetical protein